MHRFIIILACAISAAVLISPSADADSSQSMPHPDFTKGDPIPDGATHDWTLGATGARGWIYSDQLETSKARQIYITQIAKGSPADGVLSVGDVILGIGEQPFASDPRPAFGKALTQAEADDGQLTLLRWRAGKTEPIVVNLPVLGFYSATTPYNCSKSRRILEQGCDALAKQIKDGSYNPNPISRSLNGLALLASGNPKYKDVIAQEAQWASYYSRDGFQTWYYGYVISFLAEYVIATGDLSAMNGLRELALEAAKGQSIVGSWGHGFANPDGRLGGYGMMNAPGVPLTISLVLARKAGVDDPIVSTAIERSAKLLRFYIGKGAVPYGDHDPWIQTHEDNGKCGMAAVLFNLLGESDGARFFSRMSLASHGPERDTGHTGNFWNMTWAMPGVAQSGPRATAAWMGEFGAWYFDLARQHDGKFRHQGPPEPDGDSTRGWDATGAYLLAYAMPLKKIVLTGKEAAACEPIDAQTAKSIIEDGRGWSNSDRNSYYDALFEVELMERLGSWSPVVRERAAMALTRNRDPNVRALIRLLRSESMDKRLGACQALEQLGSRSAEAVSALRKTLQDDDLWLRVKAARALVAIGPEARRAAPELLKMLAREPGPDDPRAMEQRYLCFALFGRGGGLLGDTFEDVDRTLLLTGIRAGLRNEDGRARGSLTSVLQKLPENTLKILLPEIHQAVAESAPSGIMFANQIRVAGLETLGRMHVKEGIDASVDYLVSQNRWGSENRTGEILKVLELYGVHAQSVIPRLETAAADFADGEPDFPLSLSKQKAQMVLDAIQQIKASKVSPKLISIK